LNYGKNYLYFQSQITKIRTDLQNLINRKIFHIPNPQLYFNSEEGKEGQYVWIKDIFKNLWQTVPIILTELLNEPDRAKAQEVINAMLQVN
jgi:predicted 3-demethylubiquinone-9 3-methyltransferase (glyoxalase superfamily)